MQGLEGCVCAETGQVESYLGSGWQVRKQGATQLLDQCRTPLARVWVDASDKNADACQGAAAVAGWGDTALQQVHGTRGRHTFLLKA